MTWPMSSTAAPSTDAPRWGRGLLVAFALGLAALSFGRDGHAFRAWDVGAWLALALAFELLVAVAHRRQHGARARLESLVRSDVAEMVVVDRDHRPMLWSPRWHQQHGRGADGGPLAARDLASAIDRCLRHGQGAASGALGGASEASCASWLVLPWPNDDGSASALVVLDPATSRSDRERLEASAQLAAAASVAVGTAHDLNNILAVLRLSLDDLVANPESADGRRESVEAMAAALDAATGLVGSVIGLARHESAEPREVRLVPLAEELVELLKRTLLRGHDVRFEATCDRELAVIAVRSRLMQLMLNLLVNARDATAVAGCIRVTIHRDAASVLVTVADEGRGMDSETRARLFRPLFTTKGRRGLGLGLMIVRSVVAECGGSLCVRTQPGQGTSFEVRLPVAVVAA